MLKNRSKMQTVIKQSWNIKRIVKWRWKSQTEVDNGVHPLHWATYLGPSPMGTNPINGFKMVQNGSGISEHQLQQL